MEELAVNTRTFKITGLHCEACTKLTAKRIKGIPGVTDAVVDLKSGRAEVVTDRELALGEIKTVLTGSEYNAEEYHE